MSTVNWKCPIPTCGTYNADTWIVCNNCGAPNPDYRAPTPEPKAETATVDTEYAFEEPIEPKKAKR